MKQIPSFNAYIEKSIKDHWNLNALTDYKGKTLQYHDVARKIEKLHILFESGGIFGHYHLRCGCCSCAQRVYARTDL